MHCYHNKKFSAVPVVLDICSGAERPASHSARLAQVLGTVSSYGAESGWLETEVFSFVSARPLVRDARQELRVQLVQNVQFCTRTR
jgi:hypothetical protein